MSWPKKCTFIQCSKRQRRFLVFAGTIILISAIVTAVVVTADKSKSRSNPAVHTTQPTTISPFNVTYMFVDRLNQSSLELNFSSIERANIARSFESSLNLSVQNVLEIRNIFSTTAIGNTFKSRRRRSVQCDRDTSGMSGPALTFDFNLRYPTNLSCQSQTCIDQVFAEVNRQFRSVSSLPIDVKNERKQLRLCSISVGPSKANESLEQVTTSIANTTRTQTFTTISVTTSRSNATTLNFSTTKTSVTTAVLTTQTVVSATSSNLTSNESMSAIDVCVRKLPITQEPTAPYRISHTSTLFYEDEHVLLVVGASRFETTIDIQTVERQIIINGVMVYNNCQRTLDVSLPMLYNPSASS